jgi:hypothetical protein
VEYCWAQAFDRSSTSTFCFLHLLAFGCYSRSRPKLNVSHTARRMHCLEGAIKIPTSFANTQLGRRIQISHQVGARSPTTPAAQYLITAKRLERARRYTNIPRIFEPGRAEGRGGGRACPFHEQSLFVCVFCFVALLFSK